MRPPLPSPAKRPPGRANLPPRQHCRPPKRPPDQAQTHQQPMLHQRPPVKHTINIALPQNTLRKQLLKLELPQIMPLPGQVPMHRACCHQFFHRSLINQPRQRIQRKQKLNRRSQRKHIIKRLRRLKLSQMPLLKHQLPPKRKKPIKQPNHRHNIPLWKKQKQGAGIRANRDLCFVLIPTPLLFARKHGIHRESACR